MIRLPGPNAWKWLTAAAAAGGLAAGVALLGGRPTVQPKGPAAGMRIVSLAPSTTEILFGLGLGDSLVGATDKCDYPPQAKDLPRVGGFGSPNIETLLALRVDLVVASGLDKRGAAGSLSKAGMRVLDVQPRSFKELFDAIGAIARAAGKPERAEPVVAAMRAELDRTASLYRAVPSQRRPRVYVEIWNDPITTVGGSSFIDEVIDRAGGINVAHDLPQPFPRVSPEQIIQWNPDVIVLTYMSRSPAGTEELTGRIGWDDISVRDVAVKTGRIVRDIPNDLLLRPGPRLVDGVRVLATRLYGHAPTGGADGPKESDLHAKDE